MRQIMENKKGQAVGVGIGVVITVFISVIVGVILFQAVAQEKGSMTDTVAVANTSISTVVNGTSQYLTDYRAISNVVIYNETNDELIGSGNYTINNNVVYNGALAVEIVPDTTDVYKSAWQISGTAQPLTYVDDSGGRAMVNLVIIMFALAIAVVSMYPFFKSSVFKMFGR